MNALTLRNALPATIFAQRVTLRAPQHADVSALVSLANNRKIHDLLANLPHPYTSAEALDFVENIAHRADQRAYAIADPTGRLMGVAGLKFAGPAPELGYWLGEMHWGNGFGTEAVRALLAAADTTRRFPAIVAKALAHNTGSIRVLEKAGFIKTGEETRDHGRHAGATVSLYRRKREL